MSEWKQLIKNSTFIHLYRVLFLVSSAAHSRWFKQLNTLRPGRVAKASPFPEGFHYGSKLVCRLGFSLCLAGQQWCGSLAWGMPRVSQHLYSGSSGHSKNQCTGQCTHSTPPCCELAISRMKRGGVEVITAGHILSLTGVISTSTTRMQTLTSTHLLSLYIKHFTLYLSRKLWEMSTWMHRVPVHPS